MKLTKEKLLDGAKKSLENSNELIQEAKLLYKNEHYSRAYTLFQLSMEEVGKSSLLFMSVLFNTLKSKEDENKLLKELRDHKIKTEISQRIDYIVAFYIKDKTLKQHLIENYKNQSKKINEINNLKNYSLYVSLIDDSFVKPSEKISKTIVDEYKYYAETRYLATKQFQSILALELNDLILQFKNIDIKDVIDSPSQDMLDFISFMRK